MLYIMNTSFIPSNFIGRVNVNSISVSEAQRLIKSNGFVSVVGHESSAKVLSKILGVEIPMNRVSIQVESGDAMICFQLKERLPEGYTPTEEDLFNLEYQLRYFYFE